MSTTPGPLYKPFEKLIKITILGKEVEVVNSGGSRLLYYFLHVGLCYCFVYPRAGRDYSRLESHVPRTGLGQNPLHFSTSATECGV